LSSHRNFVSGILLCYFKLEIDRCGFFGADTNMLAIHGTIADTDISNAQSPTKP